MPGQGHPVRSLRSAAPALCERGVFNRRMFFPLFLVFSCPGLVAVGSDYVFAFEVDCDPSRGVAIHQALPRGASFGTASFPRPVAAHVAKPWARVATLSLSSDASHRVVLHILAP